MRLITRRVLPGRLSVQALLVTALLFGAAGVRATTAETAAQTAAQAAAANWLALVDAGEYARSWAQAADYMRRVTAEPAWASSVAHARAICGALKSRRLQSVYATSNLPDSPPGHYVVIHYASRFAHNSPATETLTLIEGPKGVWRVVGYYIS